MSSYESWQRSGRWDDEDRAPRRRANPRRDPMTPPPRGSRERWDDVDDEADEPYPYRRPELPEPWDALLWGAAPGARRRAWAWRVPGPFGARTFRGRW
jgi:hypothetical protein